MATILITGGSGLIGRRLTGALLEQGHEVRWLSRKAGLQGEVRAFAWDVHAGTLDRAALAGVDHIVHLAGAGIADQRWTNARVQELIASRAASARLLLRAQQEAGAWPRCLVSAAGIGYYGAVTSERILSEDDPPGTDTLARISVEWERAADEWSAFTRVAKLRTPVVLAREGGALPKLARPVRLGLGAALGSGRQCMPWIHIDDMVKAYQQALFDQRWSGAINIVGGNATNAQVMREAARALRRPFFLPNVPASVLRLALGELACVLLEGSPVSGAKAHGLGFAPSHSGLPGALRELLG
ncbi:MAG: TIGR01777 family oxidoreductase [Flavobacteriales bacterium]